MQIDNENETYGNRINNNVNNMKFRKYDLSNLNELVSHFIHQSTYPNVNF